MEGTLTDQDCTEFAEVLKNWKQTDLNNIHNALTRLKIAKFSKETFQKFQPHFKAFLKSIGSEEEVNAETVDLMQQCRANFKKIQEGFNKTKADITPILLIKKSSSTISEIEVPKSLGSALSLTRKSILQSLYKSFVNGLPQQYKDDPSLVDYLSKIEAHLYQNSKGDHKAELKLAGKVLESLSPAETLTARIRMLKGEIPPADVAQDKSRAFMSDNQIKQYEQISNKQLKYADVNFYTLHLKNMTGTETCRYCKKELSAYCEYQKQTRRSDEPMTRFMRCKLCDRSWRD